MKRPFEKSEIDLMCEKIKISQGLILDDDYLEKISPNLSQLKLFLYAVGLIETKQTEFVPVKLNSRTIAKVLGKKISGGQIASNIYSQLQGMDKVGCTQFELFFKEPVVHKIFVESFCCSNKPLTCEFILADYLKPYLLEVAGKPCCFMKLCYVKKFKSQYSLRLYIYLNALVKMKNYVTIIEKLIATTNYRGRKDNFISRVLKPALDFINRNTNLTALFVPIKKNHLVVGFIIKCALKDERIVSSCGLEFFERKDGFDNVTKYIPKNSISQPIQFDGLFPSQQNIISGLQKKYFMYR